MTKFSFLRAAAWFGLVGLVYLVSVSGSNTLYSSQIAGCHRNNPARRGQYEFYILTANSRRKSAETREPEHQRRIDHHFAVEAHRIAFSLLKAPHVRADGSVECDEAVKHP